MIGEELPCECEAHNAHDLFAVAVMKEDDVPVVGYFMHTPFYNHESAFLQNLLFEMPNSLCNPTLTTVYFPTEAFLQERTSHNFLGIAVY